MGTSYLRPMSTSPSRIGRRSAPTVSAYARAPVLRWALAARYSVVSSSSTGPRPASPRWRFNVSTSVPGSAWSSFSTSAGSASRATTSSARCQFTDRAARRFSRARSRSADAIRRRRAAFGPVVSALSALSPLSASCQPRLVAVCLPAVFLSAPSRGVVVMRSPGRRGCGRCARTRRGRRRAPRRPTRAPGAGAGRLRSVSFSCSHRKVAIADLNAPRLQRQLRERLRAHSRSRGGPSDSSTSSVSSETGDASSVRSAMSITAASAGSSSTSRVRAPAQHLARLREQRRRGGRRARAPRSA